MNTFQFILLFCITALQVHGQSAKNGDRHFAKAAYYSASQAYGKALKKSVNPQETAALHYKLGLALLKMNRIIDASEHLQQAIQGGIHNGECYRAYATTCQSIGNYATALEYFEKSRNLPASDPLIQAKINSCHYAMAPRDTNPDVKIIPVDILNTSGSEYGVCYYKDGSLLYSSTGSADSLEDNSISQRTGMGFSRIYLAKKENGDYTSGQELRYANSTYGNDGGLAYTPAGDKLYCTRFEINGSGYFIYNASISFNKIFEISGLRLPKNIQNFGHPAFSEDGKRLYFTSTMPGGLGQADIWYVEQTPSGKWSDPRNAGAEVNSPGNETFPYVFGNKLYFSSDYHPGWGGFDLFVCDIAADRHIARKHLTAPFNSSWDDFNLIPENDNHGILISNRNTTQSDDIFEFNGKITAETYRLPIPAERMDTAAVRPVDITAAQETPEKKSPVGETAPQQLQTFTLHDIYYEFGKAVLLNSSKKHLDPLIEMLKQYPALTVFIGSHTDARGDAQYNRTLSEKRAAAAARYLIMSGIDSTRVHSRGYGESQLLFKHPASEQEHLLNRRTTCTLAGAETYSKQLSICQAPLQPDAIRLMPEGRYISVHCGFDKNKRKEVCKLLHALTRSEIIENLEKGGWKVYSSPGESLQTAEAIAAQCKKQGIQATVVNFENEQ